MKRNLLITYAVLFGAYIGISLPLPLMGPLILSAHSPFIIPTDFKHLYLSLVLAAFPLGHLLGAPLMGALSDRFGRKKMLLVGLSGGAIFYAFSALAIYQGNILSLMVSRFLSGLFEGNAAIAQSFLVTISTEENKARRFGVMGAVMSVGYIMGPVIGGIFQTSTAFRFSSVVLPFLLVAIFLLLTMVFVALFLDSKTEKKGTRIRVSHAWSQMVESKTLVRFFILALILAIGRSLYVDFLASVLKLRFNLEPTDTRWLWAFTAAIWGVSALSAGIGARLISPQRKVILASILAAFTLILSGGAQEFTTFFVLGCFAVVGLSIAGTLLTVFVSDNAPREGAGFAMGLLGSTILFGELIACGFGGYLLSLSTDAPFILSGSALGLLSLGFMYLFWRPSLRIEAFK